MSTTRITTRITGKTLGALALLQLALPVNAAVTAAALVAARFAAHPSESGPTESGPTESGPTESAASRRTVLISGGKMTKALQLARSFHAAGHRVVLVEAEKYRFTGHRFSGAVDRFYAVPKPQDPGYAEALLEIVQREAVDVYVPVCSPVASQHDADAAKILSPYCEVVHADSEMVRSLDDKFAFSAMAASLGLDVPECYRITDPQQIRDFDFAAHPDTTYILKSLAYDPVRRLDLTRLPRPTAAGTAAFAASLPVSPDNPWIMQAFITGQEFCTHSTVRHGALTVYCCCESSAFQVNYAMVDNPAIEAWVRRFVGAFDVTGQLSFDFIQAEDGRVYAIECNPRTHSAITMFYNHPGLAAAYLEDGSPTLTPLASSRATYWLYHELWRILAHPRTAPQRLAVIAQGKEAIFDRADPLPFFLEHHLQIPKLLLGNLRHARDWMRIDFNIGKLVEPAGD